MNEIRTEPYNVCSALLTLVRLVTLVSARKPNKKKISISTFYK